MYQVKALILPVKDLGPMEGTMPTVDEVINNLPSNIEARKVEGEDILWVRWIPEAPLKPDNLWAEFTEEEFIHVFAGPVTLIAIWVQWFIAQSTLKLVNETQTYILDYVDPSSL